MNPFNPSTKKKTLKKKPSSPAVSCASSSSDLLTTAGTRVRKPFHQIYLEEIARKSKTALTTEFPAKNIEYHSSSTTDSRLTEKNKYNPDNSSCDDLSEALQQLRLFEGTNSDEHSKHFLKVSSTSTLSSGFKSCDTYKPLCLSQSYGSTRPRAIDLSVDEIIQPQPIFSKTSEKYSTSSETETGNTSTLTSLSENAPELLSFYEDFYDKTPEIVDIFEPLEIPSFLENPLKSSFKSQLMPSGRNDDKNKTSVSKNMASIDSPSFADNALKSPYKSHLRHGEKNYGKSKPSTSTSQNIPGMDIPSFVENPLKSLFKSQLKPSGKNDNKNKPSTSTSETIPGIDSPSFIDNPPKFSFTSQLKPGGKNDKNKPSTSRNISGIDILSFVEKPLKSPVKLQVKHGGKIDEKKKPSTSTSRNIRVISKNVPVDIRDYYKKLGTIPKTFGFSKIKTSTECKQQKSFRNMAKVEPSAVSKVLAKKGLKTETVTKVSSVPPAPLKDVLFSEISPYSWKLRKDVKPLKPSRYPRTSFLEKKLKKNEKYRDVIKSRGKDGSPILNEAVKQTGETSSSECNLMSAKTSLKDILKSTLTSSNPEAITEDTTLNLGDFNHDLGEAILDSIFLGNDFDDYEDYLDSLTLIDPKDKTENEDTIEEKDSTFPTELSEIMKFLQSKPFCGQGGGADSPDLEFIYDDTDTHGNEIAELYSYTEQPELQLNVRAFEDQMESYNLPPSWQRLPVEKRKSVVMKLLDQLEVSKKTLRMRSARCLLYIAQGCWAEMQSDTEQQHWARINCMLLYQLGAFSAFTDLLNIEIENSTAAHVAMRKIAVSLADSQDLRVILSVLYTITEVIRNEKATDNSEYKSDVDAFCYEIGNASGDELLVIKLLGMVTRFCSGAAPHFPMKKVLLLLWKLILVSLGGMTALKDLKAEKRQRAGLPPQDEDTMEIARTMRSSSPPASASDLLEAQNQKRNTRPFRRSLMKQSSLDDQESLGMEMETSMGNDNGDDLADMTEYDERRPNDNSDASQMYNNHNINMYNRQMSPPPQHDVLPRGLPWKPKVRQKDIDMFLDGARQKFLGYSLPGDQATLFGLPEPIHEGVKILKEHVYTSLAELQIQKEEEIARNPLSTDEEEIDVTPAEILYQAMLPNLPQYMIALLKILLAAAPTSKAKTDSINIMADVLPEEMPMTVLQSMKLGIDVNRHKEIIVKAVSAVLLLLLKHLKLNHIYQFEFMSQHLVFANCIPLVLKFFNQNIMAYVGAKNVIPILDFPSCVIGDQPELTAESLEIGDAAAFSWRNMFSCINLLRILNKLTKWKHSRIMMLVVFKSAPILKRTLKVRHAMTQLYVLKLLKMQTKYLGRQWRKSNMKTISAIYQKVRHRLNDDWAYGNDLDARPWDFQAEECALRASVDRFNNRRYTLINESDFEPVDNCLSSVLGANHELSENFKTHYSLWLEQEVFGTPIEWDKLLLNEDSL